MTPIICMGCGCTDVRPCVDLAGNRCRWVTAEEEPSGRAPAGARVGICSFCAATPLDELLERQNATVTI